MITRWRLFPVFVGLMFACPLSAVALDHSVERAAVLVEMTNQFKSIRDCLGMKHAVYAIRDYLWDRLKPASEGLVVVVGDLPLDSAPRIAATINVKLLTNLNRARGIQHVLASGGSSESIQALDSLLKSPELPLRQADFSDAFKPLQGDLEPSFDQHFQRSLKQIFGLIRR